MLFEAVESRGPVLPFTADLLLRLAGLDVFETHASALYPSGQCATDAPQTVVELTGGATIPRF